MRLRTLLAGALLTGGLALLAPAASAQPEPHTRRTPPTSCDRAHGEVATLQHWIDAANAEITKAQARVAKLRAEGHNELADKLAHRVDEAKGRVTELQAKVAKINAAIAAHCTTSSPTV